MKVNGFKEYPKIHRLGKEEVDDILIGNVLVQEKVDGANISIWWDNDSSLVKCGTRTRELPLDDSFNGFQEAVRSNKMLLDWVEAHPELRLYGEWLVKHTITYPDDAYRKIYLFDVLNEDAETYLPQYEVAHISELLGVEYPKLFTPAPIEVTLDRIKEWVGKSFIGANGEGVVIKNEGFKNKFGDLVYAKVVHERFKESNAIVFGGNNKNSEAYNEMYIINKYATLGRVQKIMQKLQNITEKRLDMEHTSQVAGACYHDMLTEEIWDIQKKIHQVDFKRLQRLSMKKFIQIYHDVLNNSISIADSGKEER
jgi:hypothetical protein